MGKEASWICSCGFAYTVSCVTSELNQVCDTDWQTTSYEYILLLKVYITICRYCNLMMEYPWIKTQYSDSDAHVKKIR